MKTLKTTLLVILILIISFSCNSQNKIKPSDYDNEKCPENATKSRPLEVIVNFDECAVIQKPKEIENAIKRLINMGYVPIDTCDCNQNLILFKDTDPAPDPLHQEERLGDGREKIVANGKSLGTIEYNVEITLDTIPSKEFINIKSFEGKKFERQIVVAVIDGGLNWERFEPYLWKNPNSGNCGDDHGINLVKEGTLNFNHGSTVSSFIVQEIDKSAIKLMDIRIFNESGTGSLFEASCAMSFAVENGANVINTSWGYYNKKYDPSLFDFVKKASYRDIVVVSSAGNDGKSTDKCDHFPSGFDEKVYHNEANNVIAVAYLNEKGNDVHKNSNYGVKSVSLAARGIFKFRNEAEILETIEGSSFAAPQVTREISKIMGLKPEWNHQKVMNCLLNQVIDNKMKVETGGKLPEPINMEVCED